MPASLRENMAARQPMRILVVEDDVIVALSLRMFLRELGHTVVGCVRTASAAVQESMLHRPDLVLMDVGLVGRTDGARAAFAIWIGWGIRSILFTDRRDERTLDRARKARPLALLAKPVGPQGLRQALDRACNLLGARLR